MQDTEDDAGSVLLGRPAVATPDSTAFLALVFGAAGGACFS